MPAAVMPTVVVDTTRYERAHGKKPRGMGSWAFCPRDKYDAGDYLKHTYWASANMTYSAAKREAVAHFKACAPALSYVELVACS